MYILRIKTTDKIHSDIMRGLVFEITYKRSISVTHYGHCIIVALSGNHDSDRNSKSGFYYCFSQQLIAKFNSLIIYCNSCVKIKLHLISEFGLMKHNIHVFLCLCDRESLI